MLKKLCRILLKMSAFRIDFDETKYMFLLNYRKNIMKFGKNLKVPSKKNLRVNQYIMKNI